jgi:hypothetical protein
MSETDPQQLTQINQAMWADFCPLPQVASCTYVLCVARCITHFCSLGDTVTKQHTKAC